MGDLKIILFSPEKSFENPLRKVEDLVTDQNLHLRMQALMGIQEDIQNKNSYRPHVRSEAGYDIPLSTVAIKTTVESGM